MFVPIPLSDPMLGVQKDPPPLPAEDKWLVGLDLGQSLDFSAMVVLRRTEKRGENETIREYDCPAVHRWPLGTTYPQIVADLKVKLAKLPDKPTLIVDGTGCGRPVVDMILRAGLPVQQVSPVTITGGTTAGRNGFYRSVPKRNVVGALMSVTHHGRLHIDKELPELNTLTRELRAFTAKVTRVDDGCCEWECSECRQRWTVKDGEPGYAYFFWPGDIDAALDDDLEPFFAGA
jgi:hypothetical protein